jgi:diaminopimelate decarboxylase
VTTLNLGGGYKVGRMNNEVSTDLQTIGTPVAKMFENFALKFNRKLKLEIEPGTFLMANTGVLLSTVQDIVETKSSGDGGDGFKFLKLDTGMTEVLRPSL